MSNPNPTQTERREKLLLGSTSGSEVPDYCSPETAMYLECLHFFFPECKTPSIRNAIQELHYLMKQDFFFIFFFFCGEDSL